MVEFDMAVARRKISKEAFEVLELAGDLGYHLSWASAKQQAVSLYSPFDERKMLLPMTSVNAKRLRSLKTQVIRHADPEKVKESFDLETLANKNRAEGKIPLTFDIVTDNDVTTKREGMTLSPEVERAINQARIRIAEAEPPTPTLEPARPDDYVPADTHVVSETPWMVRKGGKQGQVGRMYESHSVIHRVWSDGKEDFRCRFCPYTSENPRGVSGHASRTKVGHPSPGEVEIHRVAEYQPTEIKHPLSGIRRLTSELTHALDSLPEGWCDDGFDAAEVARTLAEHVYAMRPDRPPTEPLTAEQIVHRISLMVDTGRLAEMHQQVEATAEALREAESQIRVVSYRAAEMEARVTALTDERRALRDMLTIED